MQVARVAVSEEQWRAFRQLALARELSVSSYLGQLVTAELKRRKAMTVGAVASDAAESDQAIAALVDVRASIDALNDIAGRLSRSATAHRRVMDRRRQLAAIHCRPGRGGLRQQPVKVG